MNFEHNQEYSSGDWPTSVIDESSIEAMVHRFYGLIREDGELAPIFESRMEDWPHHLERMQRFWGAVLLGHAGFKPSPKGPPPTLHWAIEELTVAHFDRWFELFDEVTRELFVEERAREIQARARRIGQVLSTRAREPERWSRRLA